MIISMIVAVASNGVIGCKNRLIWHISEDLKRFKRLTTAHPIVMGRKTFESLGRPLPGRLNVVITRNPNFTAPEGVVIAGSLEAAIAHVKAISDEQVDELFIIGGGEIYRQAMPLADRLYITHIEATPEGDTLFPDIDHSLWREILSEDHPRSRENPIGYRFADYQRRTEC